MEPVVEIKGSSLLVRLPKEVDHPSAEVIRRKTDQIMEHTYIRRIEFDFAHTEFMDSSGIGLMMGRYRKLGMRKGCISACGASRYIEKLLRLSGVHRYVEICRAAEMVEE